MKKWLIFSIIFVILTGLFIWGILAWAIPSYQGIMAQPPATYDDRGSASLFGFVILSAGYLFFQIVVFNKVIKNKRMKDILKLSIGK